MSKVFILTFVMMLEFVLLLVMLLEMVVVLADGPASKGHHTDEQGIDVCVGIGFGNSIGIDNQKDIKVGSFGDPIFTFQSW